MDTKQTDEYLAELGVQEKQYDVLYRKVANAFELPDCSMWILYYRSSSENPLSQQDLIEKMMFPKQTINSAVTGMVKKGLLELQMIPGTRNRKEIRLTDIGDELVGRSVKRMRRAEEKAVQNLGDRKMQQYMILYREFYSALERNFKEEELI